MLRQIMLVIKFRAVWYQHRLKSTCLGVTSLIPLRLRCDMARHLLQQINPVATIPLNLVKLLDQVNQMIDLVTWSKMPCHLIMGIIHLTVLTGTSSWKSLIIVPRRRCKNVLLLIHIMFSHIHATCNHMYVTRIRIMLSSWQIASWVNVPRATWSVQKGTTRHGLKWNSGRLLVQVNVQCSTQMHILFNFISKPCSKACCYPVDCPIWQIHVNVEYI